MTFNNMISMRALLGASALVLTLAAPVLADTVFTTAADSFAGNVQAAAATRGAPLHAGDKFVVTGTGLVPGQQITLQRGGTVLNADGPLTVDAEGGFVYEGQLDADAQVGLQPVLVIAENPAAATVTEMKISPVVAAQGAEKFEIASEGVVPGLYQVGYSKAADALFLTSAVGRPPVKESALVKVDPATLKVVAQIAPEAAPARPDGREAGVFAVYGVGVDDTNGNVWVSNTRQDTIAVYRQDDLSLVKQFAPGTVPHSRDVVIDEGRGRAYASTSVDPTVHVFDTKTLEELDPITVQSGIRGEDFGTMSLALDAEGGKLYTVSLNTPEAAEIDLETGTSRIIPLTHSVGASGVAYDAQDGLLFIASQGTDNLLIVDAKSGETRHDVAIGAGPLNVTFDPVSRQAFVVSRSSGTIAVVDPEGNLIANIEAGTFPNQIASDGKGTIYAVNKSRGEDDDKGDRIWRLTPAKE